MMTPSHINALLQREREREVAERLAFIAARQRGCCPPRSVVSLVTRARRQPVCLEGAC